jgi:hypothetical protein
MLMLDEYCRWSVVGDWKAALGGIYPVGIPGVGVPHVECGADDIRME